MGREINYIDFELEIIIDLTNPGVADSYRAWNKMSEALSKKNVFDITQKELEERDQLKSKFIEDAYACNAVTRMT